MPEMAERSLSDLLKDLKTGRITQAAFVAMYQASLRKHADTLGQLADDWSVVDMDGLIDG